MGAQLRLHYISRMWRASWGCSPYVPRFRGCPYTFEQCGCSLVRSEPQDAQLDDSGSNPDNRTILIIVIINKLYKNLYCYTAVLLYVLTVVCQYINVFGHYVLVFSLWLSMYSLMAFSSSSLTLRADPVWSTTNLVHSLQRLSSTAIEVLRLNIAINILYSIIWRYKCFTV